MNEIKIYGEIGCENNTDSILVPLIESFVNQDLKIRLNCVGGDVFQGYAIYNAIKSQQQTDIYIEGVAASMASICMLGARKIYASTNAMIMIHNPSIEGFAGDVNKLASLQQVLTKVKDLAINSYEARTGIDKETLSVMLDAETWMTAQEALEKGFIDGLTDAVLETNIKEPSTGLSPKSVFLSYKGKPKEKSLYSILNITENSSADIVLKAISKLNNENISLKAQVKRFTTQIEETQTKEAKELIKLALDNDVLNQNLVSIQLLAFKQNFSQAKDNLIKAINEVTDYSILKQNQNIIKSIVFKSKNQTTEITEKNKDVFDKPKEKWTLEDYRKHEPKALENKDFYQSLIDKEFKN